MNSNLDTTSYLQKYAFKTGLTPNKNVKLFHSTTNSIH